METFRQVFVTIDFSPASDEALRRAHERASANRSRGNTRMP
jgi:hypothetical protein